MKPPHLFLLLGACGAGLAAGYAGKRFSGAPAAAEAPPGEPSAAPARAGQAGSPAAAGNTAPRAPLAVAPAVSKDTLESIKAVEGPELYARLASWLAGAGEEDIAAYWQHYRGQEKRSNDINDLIFINWARVNPRGATAATAGTPDEHYTWWAWACHDPAAALAAAKAENPDRINNVTWGIGEFHPTWLREHFEELPEGSRYNAFQGMFKWPERGDPAEAIEFLLEKDQSCPPGFFNALAARDPWTAYDMLQDDTKQSFFNYYGNRDSAMQGFIETLSRQDPEVLERMAEQAPSGEAKRLMETTLFARLVEQDPEAALEQARKETAPFVASERLAQAALTFVSSDPERAFEIAEELLRGNPGALNRYTKIQTGTNTTYYGSGSSNFSYELSQLLMAKDPERLMEVAAASADTTRSGPGDIFGTLAQQWQEQDAAGFAEWAGKLTEPKQRNEAYTMVMYRLMNEGNHADAVEWAAGMGGEHGDHHLQNVLTQWSRQSPEDAAAWVDAAGLDEKTAARLKKSIEASKQQ